MNSPEELTPDKLKSISQIREKAEVMTSAQMKAAILKLDNVCEKWENKQSGVMQIIAISLGAVFSGLISSRGFAEAVKDLNLMQMLHINPLATTAVFILPICLLIYTRYRRYKLASALEQKILVECLLEKME